MHTIAGYTLHAPCTLHAKWLCTEIFLSTINSELLGTASPRLHLPNYTYTCIPIRSSMCSSLSQGMVVPCRLGIAMIFANLSPALLLPFTHYSNTCTPALSLRSSAIKMRLLVEDLQHVNLFIFLCDEVVQLTTAATTTSTSSTPNATAWLPWFTR